MKAPRSGESSVVVLSLGGECNGSDMCRSPSDVARSLPPECVEKGLNGPGECVVSEIELVIVFLQCEQGMTAGGKRQKFVGETWSKGRAWGWL